MYDIELFPTNEYVIESGVRSYKPFFVAETNEISFLKDKISVKVIFSNKIDAENFFNRDYLGKHIGTIGINGDGVSIDVSGKNISAVLTGNIIYFQMKL